MIKISITANKNVITDCFDDADCTLQEVALALIKLKQIEQILIDKEFKSDFEMREE